MTKHVLDRPRAPDTSRAQKFLQAERREGLHPATRSLLRRERPDSADKTRNFLRIARHEPLAD